MTVEELRDAIATTKEEMRTLVENAETEKRSLNDEEKAAFEANQAKMNDLKAELVKAEEEAQRSAQEIVNQPKTETTKNSNIRMKKQTKKIAEAMQALANNRSTEEFSFVSGNSINLRADGDYDGTVHNDTEAIDDEEKLPLLEPLQDAFVLDKLGVKIINSNKALKLPSVANVEAEIAGEAVELTATPVEFTKTDITPFRVGIAMPFTSESIRQADRNIVDYAVKLGGKAIANVLNKIVCSPVGVNGKEGPFVGVADSSTQDLTWTNVVALEADVKEANVDIDETAAFICSPATEAKLKTTAKKDSGSGRFALEDGKIDGYPVIVTQACVGKDSSTNADIDYIGFGVFSNLMIQNVSNELVIDNISKSRSAITDVVMNGLYSVEVTRPEAFAGFALA